MATAASRYATSASRGTLLNPQAPCQQKHCNSQRRVSIRCNAAQERVQLAKSDGVAASRRSLLAAGIALPFSVLLVDKAQAFVEEEGVTESERQRRELVQAIQERAAREKERLETAAAETQEAVESAGSQVVEAAEDAGTAVKTQIEEAAPKVEAKIEEAAPKVEAKIQEAAPKVEKVAEEAPKAAAPVESVQARVEQAAEAVTTKVEAAAENVRSKIQEVVASPSAADAGNSASKVEAPAPQLPRTGPGSAERIREANIRRPTKAEKYSGNPDDVNPSDPIYQRMDSSKMPDLPYLFPKENYGTPWVPPADAPADKIKMFFGPWDIGPQPEKEITRPFRELEFEETLFPLGMGLSAMATAVGFWVWNIGKPEVNWDLLRDPTGVIDSAPQKDGDGGNGVASIYLAIVNLVVIGGYLVAKKAQKGELDDLLPLLVETKEGETDEEKEEPVQQMQAEKAAFDAAEAERIARGEPEEDSKATEESKH